MIADDNPIVSYISVSPRVAEIKADAFAWRG